MLATTILFSRKLSTIDYGIYQSIWSFISVCIVISTFGIPRYILTFGKIIFTKQQTKLVGLLFIIFSLLSCYVILFYPNISLFEKMFLLGIVLSQSIFLIQESNIIYDQKNEYLIWTNLAYAILLFISQVIIAYQPKFSLINSLIAILLVSITRNIVIYFYYTQKNTNIITQNINIKELNWFGLNDLISILSKWFDKFILLFLLTPIHFAIYFNGTFEIPLIGMLLSVFQSIMASHNSAEKMNDEEQIQLFNSSSLIMSGILFPLATVCVFYSSEIVNIIFSAKYSESSILFAISALILPLRICNYSVLLQLKEQGKTIIIGSILEFAVIIILMWILYPFFQLKGLIIAGVIGIYLLAAFYTFHICKNYQTTIFKMLDIKQLLIRLLICTLTIGSIKFFVPNHFASMCMTTILAIILCYIFIGKIILKGFFEGKKFNQKS